MTLRSVASRNHAALICARTRRLNATRNSVRGIATQPRRSAKQADYDRSVNGEETIDDRLGTRAFADKQYWKGDGVADSVVRMVDILDKRRAFLYTGARTDMRAGHTVWLDFRLASSKSAGGVAASPFLNELIALRGGDGIMLTVQVNRVNISNERQRTGMCMCRIDHDASN